MPTSFSSLSQFLLVKCPKQTLARESLSQGQFLGNPNPDNWLEYVLHQTLENAEPFLEYPCPSIFHNFLCKATLSVRLLHEFEIICLSFPRNYHSSHLVFSLKQNSSPLNICWMKEWIEKTRKESPGGERISLHIQHNPSQVRRHY